MNPIPVQMALFEGENVLVGLHVVASHTRVLSDGTQVFVGEHLRWDRGRTGARMQRARAAPADDAQIPLFGPGRSA